MYKRADVNDAVLVDYNGDHTVAADFPHGNAKNTTKTFTRTKPSVLTQIASTPASTLATYTGLVAAGASEEGSSVTDLPRNMEQVRNVRKALRNKKRLEPTLLAKYARQFH